MTPRNLLVALAAPTIAEAANWAVIAAGSSGYSNYRHQADACHAYQIMRSKGIPEDHIIMMAYDDIAHNEQNPFPGKIFNAPDPDGPGINVYEGCNIDYRQSDVTAKKFLDVITGEGSGKVLKSTAEDHVFINFIDHGAPGLVAFPNTVMHKVELQTALAKMHSKNMFKQLVFYLETCESGSMFEDLSVPGVYAVSAANPSESSWGTYCGSDDTVNGTRLHTCLGDLFSVNWMQNTDNNDITKETLELQYETVQNATTKSHVLQWGDKSFTSDKVSDFFGNKASELELGRRHKHHHHHKPRNDVSAREAHLRELESRYAHTKSAATRMKLAKKMQKLLKTQEGAQAVYVRLTELAYPGEYTRQHEARSLKHKPNQPECELAGHKAILESCADQFDANSGFVLQFHQVVVNVCADIAQKGLNLDIRAAAMQACGKEPTVVV